MGNYGYGIRGLEEEPKPSKAVKVATAAFWAVVCVTVGILIGCELVMKPQVEALEEEVIVWREAYVSQRQNDSSLGWLTGELTQEDAAWLIKDQHDRLMEAADLLNDAADRITAYQMLVQVYENEFVPEEERLPIEFMLEATADWREWDEDPGNWGDADFGLPDMDEDASSTQAQDKPVLTPPGGPDSNSKP